MILSKFFAIVALAFGVHASSIASRNTSSVNYVPLSPEGNVAAIQTLTNAAVTSWLFYQDSAGGISVRAVSGSSFATGHAGVNTPQIAPPEAVLPCTPIAAVLVGDGTNGIHVFFLNPDRKLSEYRYSNPGGWRGGDACPQCVDHGGFAVAEGSNILYALRNPVNNIIRVGFVSPGTPGTVSEAVSTWGVGSWSIAPLPDP